MKFVLRRHKNFPVEIQGTLSPCQMQLLDAYDQIMKMFPDLGNNA